MTDSLAAELSDLFQTSIRKPPPAPEEALSDHLDSMELMTVVVAIEDHFHIIFEPEDEERAHTFGDVLDIVRAKVETT